MANFITAQKYIQQNEGYYANVSGDLGGETYSGIASSSYPNWVGFDFLSKQPHPIKWNTHFPELDQFVLDFYKKNKWDNILGDLIQDNKTGVYFYDFHVNSGRAVKIVQGVIGVIADGIFGNGSLSVLNSKNWLDEIHQARLNYLNQIGVGSNEKFLEGWINRANLMYNLTDEQAA